MDCEEIDWDHSIEQQIEQIVVATGAAHRLVRQIACKNAAHPELITKENYACFQSVIHSLAQLACEVESSPLYKDALSELRARQERKQRRLIDKHFGHHLA
jgi:hypothetical protein